MVLTLKMICLAVAYQDSNSSRDKVRAVCCGARCPSVSLVCLAGNLQVVLPSP